MDLLHQFLVSTLKKSCGVSVIKKKRLLKAFFQVEKSRKDVGKGEKWRRISLPPLLRCCPGGGYSSPHPHPSRPTFFRKSAFLSGEGVLGSFLSDRPRPPKRKTLKNFGMFFEIVASRWQRQTSLQLTDLWHCY